MNSNRMFTIPNIMNKALESAWTRQELINNNIANIDTPGYKRKDINFEQVLTSQVEKTNSIHNIDINNLYAEIISPYSNVENRMDGSNVDIDVEMAELSKNKIKYDALATQTARYFQRLKSVVNNIR